ncbi:MAG: exonuclease domain-containing protein [Acidimicrobiales bacterium]
MEPPAVGAGGDLDVPLYDVVFAVLDVETTGGAPTASALTEIAAATFRGGERLGTFQTLVDPGCALPPFITQLTGITDAMLCGAPVVSAVLPPFLEFVGDAVLVGHNIAFDLAFLDAALEQTHRPGLANLAVDTLTLARGLVRADVPNCRLATLAAALRLEHRPAHRALDDVLATADLLHRLIEEAAGYGVLRLGDLLEVPAAGPAPPAVVSAACSMPSS